MGDSRYGDAGGAVRKGGVHADAPWEWTLKELACAEEAQANGALTTTFQEGSEGEEAAANSRGEAEGEASSSHIAMLGSTGRRFLAFHIWHSSLRSPP
jgi:hypothetical protein